MNSDKLLKARAYEAEKEKEITPGMQPAFHLSARTGWMNDPNGFSYYNGQYHLFYQYYPYRTQWGPMHWAHAVSVDLLHWKAMPAALAPDMEYDRDGCFSGSAATLPDGRHLLMYTGVRIERHEDDTADEFQTQCLAVGDGVNYEKVAHNPVLTARDLPEGASARDFRDPKLWQVKDGSYRAVVANRAADGTGQVILFESKDGLDWSFKKVLAENNGRIGGMWECPDFFTLDGKGVLLISPEDLQGREPHMHPGKGCIAFIGHWDEENEVFTEEDVQVIDDGTDYYAMQTVLAPDGRRIMIAWLQNWDCQEHIPGEKWFGQMALPREITVKNGRLMQKPIRELDALHINTVAHRGVKLTEEMALPGVKGRYADMEIVLGGAYECFTVTLAKGGNFKTTLTWEPDAQLLTLDRSDSGTRRAHAHRRSCLVDTAGYDLRLRVILDRNSVEVFAGEGEKTMSMTLYTDLSAQDITFAASGEAIMDVIMHEIKH